MQTVAVSARNLAKSLNHIGIVCQPVREGNPVSLEHGEVSVKACKPMTIFVHPVDDTMYLAVWKPARARGYSDDGTYTYSPVFHYAGQLHRLIREIRRNSR